MKKCPKCSAVVEDIYAFCHKCGADLRVPLCAHCGKELPVDAASCPWCGKQLSADGNPIPRAANAEKLTFSAEEQALFRELLKKYFKDGEILTKPDRIFWEERFVGWGAVDDCSWEESEFVRIMPLNADDRAKYAKNGTMSVSDRDDMSVFFRTILENSQGCMFFEHLGSHRDGCLNVHWKDTLVLNNPYGIGMDVEVVHESFDDKD